MEKKNKKSLIIGITSLFLVMLILLGLTYAYYRTRIIGNNSNEPSINVTSKEMEVTFLDGNSNISIKSVKPGEIFFKTFSVQNTGNDNGTYSVLIDSINNSFSRIDEWVYELYEGTYDTEEDIKNLTPTSKGFIPNSSNIKVMLSDVNIAKDITKEYTLVVKYLNLKVDQSEDMEKTLSMRVNISDSRSTWNGEINEPVLAEGMIPVKWDDSEKAWIVCDEHDTEWYDYENKLWANVMLSDGKYKANSVTVGQTISIYETGSMFVWIPRYEYKTDSSNISIDVKFVPVSQTTVDTGYTYIHPAFTTDLENGGWNTELNGIWFAKYQAGYQASTINEDEVNPINANDTITYSNVYYTSSAQDDIANGVSVTKLNAVGQDISLDNYAKTKVSYPVFKASTYTYNLINIGDMYSVSRDIVNGTSFYGLSNADTHLTKNSEWGAAAYLAHSRYGLDKVNIKTNSKNLNPSKNIAKLSEIDVYTITGYTLNDRAINNSTSQASTTNNMTGIFDMSGASNERTSGYIANGVNQLKVGASFTSLETFKEGISTQYATAYPYDPANENVDTGNHYDNYLVNLNYLLNNYPDRHGDAILEVSNPTYRRWTWNNNEITFPKGTEGFFVRGGRMDGSNNGLFTIGYNDGTAPTSKTGFRAVIVVE